jgi:hypothetical protein
MEIQLIAIGLLVAVVFVPPVRRFAIGFFLVLFGLRGGDEF